MATWAAQSIDLGLGLGSVQPVVLGPASVPEVTDTAMAERETELAVLSAVGCADIATLDRWVENVLGAKTAADVLS